MLSNGWPIYCPDILILMNQMLHTPPRYKTCWWIFDGWTFGSIGVLSCQMW